MKQLEKSAEKAVEREEKLKDKILQIQQKYKAAEGRYVAIYLYLTVWITYNYIYKYGVPFFFKSLLEISI